MNDMDINKWCGRLIGKSFKASAVSYPPSVTIDNDRSPASSGYGDKFLKKVLEEIPNYFKVEMKKKDIVDGADEELMQSKKDNASKD